MSFVSLSGLSQDYHAAVKSIATATMGQLDDIIQRTEYADRGVAVGEAAADQDLRRAAQQELARRMGF